LKPCLKAGQAELAPDRNVECGTSLNKEGFNAARITASECGGEQKEELSGGYDVTATFRFLVYRPMVRECLAAWLAMVAGFNRLEESEVGNDSLSVVTLLAH